MEFFPQLLWCVLTTRRMNELKVVSGSYLGRAPCIWQRRQWHPTPVLLPGKSHGRRSLVGCSPWGHWESDTTERLHFHFSLSCIGEGNGNPLQCSCLENPRDGEAWWAAVYEVAQSRTWLKWLSSSSSSSLAFGMCRIGCVLTTLPLRVFCLFVCCSSFVLFFGHLCFNDNSV